MMVKKLLITASLASAMLVTGCASTGSSAKTDADGYPVLEVMSKTPYVWDDSISEALNVARMAQPAGVGVGMRDFQDGTKANTGRIGSTDRLLSGALSGVGMGLFGVISSEALVGGVNRNLSWRPSIVQTMNAEDVTIDGVISFKLLRNQFADLIQDSLSGYGFFDELEYLTLKGAARNSSISNLHMIIQGDFCLELRDFDGADGLMSNNLSHHFIDGSNAYEDYCALTFNIKVPYINSDGELVVVGEMGSGFILIESIASNIDSYVIFPEYFKNIHGKAFKAESAFVLKGGEKLFFAK